MPEVYHQVLTQELLVLVIYGCLLTRYFFVNDIERKVALCFEEDPEDIHSDFIFNNGFIRFIHFLWIRLLPA